jgi:plastocyanin
MMTTPRSKSHSEFRRIVGFLAGYAVVLIACIAFALTADFGANTSVARDTVDLVQAAAPVAEAVLGADGDATLTGVITFDGAVPVLKPVVAKGDMTVKDAAVCAAADVPNEELVVNADNKGIAHVFVYLAKAPAGVKPGKADSSGLVQDQKGCVFLPHSLLVPAGATIQVLNGDNVPHNTHTNPVKNEGFNKVIAPNDRVGVPLKYTKPERLPVKVVCDFHNWMKAWHMVLDHPYMAVTDADGKFTIENLPAGKHEFIIWQEKAGYLNRKYEVEVKKGEKKEVKLSFGAAKFAGGPVPTGGTVAVNSPN